MEAMLARDKYNERVSVALLPSRLAEAFVAIACIATAALAAALPLAWEAQVCAIAWTGGFTSIALGRLRACRGLEVDCSGAVAVDGVAGTLRDGSFVSPWFTVLRWRPDGAWWDRTVLVVPDRLPAGDYRRLRVLLRWSARR